MSKVNLLAWLKEVCPSVFKQSYLSEEDCRVLISVAKQRKYDILNLFLFLERVLKGEFEFNVYAINECMKSIADPESLLNVEEEPLEFISLKEAANMMNMTSADFLRKYCKPGNEIIQHLDGDSFIKQQVVLLKELED
ncbi:MAG: hypothetical protein A2V66_16865 [Ignavibacteria bacterium RBG_13_36_8]|nr:MAG: hypothetical protein A2V66_16865 [Ignavibacteria bacterium RBG_13_36_8]